MRRKRSWTNSFPGGQNRRRDWREGRKGEERYSSHAITWDQDCVLVGGRECKCVLPSVRDWVRAKRTIRICRPTAHTHSLVHSLLKEHCTNTSRIVLIILIALLTMISFSRAALRYSLSSSSRSRSAISSPLIGKWAKWTGLYHWGEMKKMIGLGQKKRKWQNWTKTNRMIEWSKNKTDEMTGANWKWGWEWS